MVAALVDRLHLEVVREPGLDGRIGVVRGRNWMVEYERHLPGWLDVVLHPCSFGAPDDVTEEIGSIDRIPNEADGIRLDQRGETCRRGRRLQILELHFRRRGWIAFDSWRTRRGN